MRSTTLPLRWLVALPLFAAACTPDTSGFALVADAAPALDLGSPAADQPAAATDTGEPATDRPALTDRPATTTDLGAVDAAITDAGTPPEDTGVAHLDAGADAPADTGSHSDTGSHTDLGTPADAGAHVDAGAARDVPVGACTVNGECASGQYCAGDGCNTPGSCLATPRICSFIVSPVCGCNGHTYNNACLANTAGVRVASRGGCDGGV